MSLVFKMTYEFMVHYHLYINFNIGVVNKYWPCKTDSMEDPDLICRVPSSASGNVTVPTLQTIDNPSKDLSNSFVSRHKHQEEPCNDVLQDHLKILSNFSGNEDPYALLRELQILPNHNKMGTNTGVDITGMDTSSIRRVDDMLNCFEGKNNYLTGNGSCQVKGPMLLGEQLENKNWHSTGIIEKKTTSQDNATFDSPLCLGLIFTFQYLPVLVIAILHKMKVTESITTVISSYEDEHDSPDINFGINNK